MEWDHLIRRVLDVMAISVAFVSPFITMPNIALGLSIIWSSIQIYDYFKRKRKK